MDQLQMHMLKKVADLHSVPEGAYNIRDNGTLAGRNTTANIDIISKEDKPGIDIVIKPGTKNESVHIPVIVSQSGLKDLVYNDFYIGEDADVVIVAGCGIHCGGSEDTEHDGIHTFHIGKNAKVKYVEKHYGEGEGSGGRILNPTTIVYIDENGLIYINGEMLAESYGKEAIADPGRAYEPVELGKDEYFVMGDNRNNSSDSRDPAVGNIQRNEFIGKAWMRIWPLNKIGMIQHQ